MAEEVAELRKQLERSERRLRDLDARACAHVSVMDACADLIDSNAQTAAQHVEALAVTDEVCFTSCCPSMPQRTVSGLNPC
jgi:hypothetical protein